MKKIFLLISIFTMLPLIAEQSQESMWKKIAPTVVASLKKAIMNPFAGFNVPFSKNNQLSFSKISEFIRQRNPFIAGLAKYAPIVKAETDSVRGKRLAMAVHKAGLNHKLYNTIQEDDVYKFEQKLEDGADLSKASDYLMTEKIECSTLLNRYLFKKSHCDVLDQMDKILIRFVNEDLKKDEYR
ncbi:MAG TPA: hypothetical protein VHO47_04680 [Candidatus Babeliales bacterium]|nr:hypothetical protein [Candidatus Babeliales bacterium]